MRPTTFPPLSATSSTRNATTLSAPSKPCSNQTELIPNSLVGGLFFRARYRGGSESPSAGSFASAGALEEPSTGLSTGAMPVAAGPLFFCAECCTASPSGPKHLTPPVQDSSHFSPARHSPRHGSRSQRPVERLQLVPLTHS